MVMRTAEMAAMEEQEREAARRRAAGEYATLVHVEVVIKQRIEFADGSAIVDEVNVPAMICVAQLMLEKPLCKVGVCPPSDGLTLSAERAENVCRWLVEQGGVSVSRLRVGSSSERLVDNGSPTSIVKRATCEEAWHIRFHVIPEVKIWDKIQFDTDSSELKPVSLPTLDAVGCVLKRHCDIAQLTIEGHCCIEGEEQTDAPNLQGLSADRAAAVQRYLVDQAGVPAERVPNIVGYSTARPCAPCDTQQNRARNRRVEFLVW